MGSELKLQVKYHKLWFWSEYNQHSAGEAVMHNDLLQEVVILYNCLHDRQETWFWLKKFNGRRAHVHLMHSRKQNDSLINSTKENAFFKLKICGLLPVYLFFLCIKILWYFMLQGIQNDSELLKVAQDVFPLWKDQR